jgi:VWFA-related protein
MCLNTARRIPRTKISSYLVLAAVLSCSASNYAKNKDNKEQANNSEIKFTSRTELVLVPTLVHKSGAHVSGLAKEDFTVLENGREQKIAVFEEVTSDAHHFSHPKNPNEFSNYLVGDPAVKRVTIIILDLLNTAFSDQVSAREQLVKYLTQSLDSRECIALYTLTRSGIKVIHDFTTDSRVLIAALQRVKGNTHQLVDTPEDVEQITGSANPSGSAGLDPSTVKTEADRLQAMMEDAELNFESFQQRVAITYTLEALQQVAQELAGFAGRKSLIWATGGFPFDVSDNTMALASVDRDSF